MNKIKELARDLEDGLEALYQSHFAEPWFDDIEEQVAGLMALATKLRNAVADLETKK